MKGSMISIMIMSFFISNLIAGSGDNDRVRVKIENGEISGYVDMDKGLNVFLGIPFAKPPVGDLRWRAPQPPDNWQGVRECTKFGNTPMQFPIWNDIIFRGDKISEDCLYLNVWMPRKKHSNPLPVLLYYYGGGLVVGDGSERRYDGAAMAQQGIITVTANYRLNIFGFFSHPELSRESSYHGSGNYGLLDQNAALRWIRKNIASFGGDPNRITIAGESAGSASVSLHMASPLSRDLIAGAIGESGAAISPTGAPVPLKEAEENGYEFAGQIGCSSLKELRAMPAEKLLQLYRESGRFGFPVTIDGYFLPKSLVEIFTHHEQAQIPLLVGWNSAEISGSSFTQGPYTVDRFVTKVKESFPDYVEALLNVYPHQTEDEVERSATDLASDRFIVYSTWKWFDLHRKHSNNAVYRYLFDHPRPPLKSEKNEPRTKPIGAAHAQEIEYCLGNLYLAPQYDWQEADYIVSKTMFSYFANFIIYGDPNGGELPEWPSVSSENTAPRVMVLDVRSRVEKAEKDRRFLVLDEIYSK